MLTLLLSLFLAAPPVQTPDAVTVFASAKPWAEYLAGVTQQRQLWSRNSAREVPAALVDRLRAAGTDLKLLVVAEDWCSDSVNSVPYLGTLAGKAGIEMRVVTSEPGKPFMDAHRTPDGRGATPTVILIRGGKEIGAWVERPKVLQSWFLDIGSRVSQSERTERKLAWYEWSRGADALNEIVTLAEANR